MTVSFDFSYFPALETERLRLRRITTDDADAIVTLYGDAEVVRYLIIEPPCTTHERALDMIAWLAGWFEKQNALRWGITLSENDTLIGTCGFHFWSPDHRRTDIGYDLQSAYWGRGYMTEAVHAMAHWCFENLDLHRIQADCTEGNIASEKVLLKVGFKLEGLWRENTFEHGRFVNIKQFGLLRDEYAPDSK